MVRYKVVYERVNCIGAAVCVAVFPKYWSMNADGKADLIGSVKSGDSFEIELDESELEQMKQSAEGCPVNVIHIFNAQTGHKII